MLVYVRWLIANICEKLIWVVVDISNSLNATHNHIHAAHTDGCDTFVGIVFKKIC